MLLFEHDMSQETEGKTLSMEGDHAWCVRQ